VFDKIIKRIWLISGAPNYDLHGNLLGSIGIHLDIDQKKARAEIKYIAEKNLNSVVIADKEGRIENSF
jgi:hypothetical protein